MQNPTYLFETSVKEIISLPDGSLKVQFYSGKTKVWQMPPVPPKKPKPKPETLTGLRSAKP